MASGSTVADSGEGALPRTYDEAVRQVWRPLAADGGLRELVRAGTLAANSHNTQPWRFRLAEHEITIHPDFTRRCPAVDPDDHHLFVSLGCAVENMVQAAPVLGFDATSALNPSNDGAITLALERRQSVANPLADAIVRRQCTRADYDGRTIAPDDLASLEAAGTFEGVTCLLITDRSRMDAIAGHVVEGNTAQMRDPAFMPELKAWIRFDDRMALAHRDGLTSRASGNPSLPAWLALARRHPQRVSALILIVPASFEPTNPVAIEESRGSRLAFWLVNAGADFAWWTLEAIAPSVLIRFIGVPPAVVSVAPEAEQVRVHRIVHSIQPLSQRVRGINLDSIPDTKPPQLERITAPTLIVSAKDDLFNTLPAARFAASRIPNARLVAFETGGHLLVGHQNDVIAEVAGFLRAAGVKGGK